MELSTWKKMNETYEAGFWDTCANTASEEHKQYTYAELMGLELTKSSSGGPWYFDVKGRSVVDIGGGPASLLLKCRNWFGGVAVVDPCPYPDWTLGRYDAASIRVYREPAETWEPDRRYDEAWIYNVIQHTMNPRAVIEVAKRAAKTIRLFEWIEWPPHPGHPHTLYPEELDEWLGSEGSVALLDENYAVVGELDTPPRRRTYSEADITPEHGPAYFGVFPT